MNESRFIGKTLRELVTASGPNHKGYAVFVLQDDRDDTGQRAGNSYTIRNLLHLHPELADHTVKIAHDYYGETILRVRKENT